jgi:dolichol-phosphate mannosyltransferase
MAVIEVVVPAFNEQENLPRLYEEVAHVFATELLDYRWRVIFVDDGSTDHTWTVLQELARRHENVRAMRLNRNRGAHLAISAGLACAEGDAAVVLAADLQDPPAVIAQFVRQWEKGSKVVWGVRVARQKEPLYRRFFSRAFHLLVRRYALPGYPSGGTGSFCLIDRTVVQNVRRMKEDFRTIFGLIAVQGYQAADVPYARQRRAQGQSGWTFKKMVRTSIDVFTSYSHLPVRALTWTGLITALLAFLGIIYQVTWYFVNPDTLRGWTMLFSAVCFFGGIQTLALGILGEYIWRTFHEVKRRPLWFVEDATFEVERSGP